MHDEEIFHQARALPPVERAAFLEKACGGDPALRASVEALLSADDETGAFLEKGSRRQPVAETFAAEARAGAIVAGRYKLLELIGEGGMGAVWLAEQTEPVKRKVALKLVKPGMDSRAVLARFEAERQALALMDHPNIARVHDGGVTERGTPFFVMELVKGLPLTEYCDARRLSVRERLDLFVPICAAVQHAHQKGIIHRDLKPSNILVTEHDGRPVPKVIDFGLAKALGAATTLTERTLHTAFGTVVGTPLYMAPEQVGINALDVDTRSDVYSLGVILYELLTGTTPLEKQRFKEAAWDEIRRVIREEEPPKPSARLSDSHDSLPSISAQRHTEPAALTRLVKGELDWIVMKALEKDRNRRYETATGFAMDVQRYLADEPVQACPPSGAYRFHKFLKRNKGPAVAAGLVLASLVLGTIGTSIGMWRAEHAKREAQAARKKAEEAEAQTLAAFRASTDDAIQQLIGSKPQLGPQEKTYLEKTLKRWQVFAGRQGDDERSMAVRQEGHFRVGTLWDRMGRLEEARKEYEAALDLLQKLVAQAPAVPWYQECLGSIHNNLGFMLYQLGEHDAARRELEAAGELLKKLVAQSPSELRYQFVLAHSRNNLGNLLKALGESDAARKEYDAARNLRKKLAAQNPTDIQYQQDLADTHHNLGNLLKALGESNAARRELEAARDLQKELVAQSPVPYSQLSLVRSHNLLGMLLLDIGEREAARKEIEAARGLCKKLFDQQPGVVQYQVELGGCYCNSGVCVYEDQPAEALIWYTRAIDVLEPIHRSNPKHVAAKQYLRNSYLSRSWPYVVLKKYAEALKDLERAIDLSPPAEQPSIRANRAYAKSRAGLFAEAVAEVAELSKSSNWSFHQLYEFACVYSVASGKIADKKKEYADRAMELLRQASKAGRLVAVHINDSDLDAIRDRDDFKKLIVDLEAKKK